MTNKILIILLLFFSLSEIQAQTAAKISEKFVIINDAIGRARKNKSEVAATIDKATGAVQVHHADSPTNLKVAPRLEIAAEDESPIAVLSANAIEACKNKNRNGGNSWRLPTIKECILILILKKKLYSLSGFTSFKSTNTSYYFSATSGGYGNDYSTVRVIDFTSYNTVDQVKTVASYVRCVRDMTP